MTNCIEEGFKDCTIKPQHLTSLYYWCNALHSNSNSGNLTTPCTPRHFTSSESRIKFFILKLNSCGYARITKPTCEILSNYITPKYSFYKPLKKTYRRPDVPYQSHLVHR